MSEDAGSGSRADRLRDRRKRTRSRASEQDKTDKTGETDKQDETSETSKTSKTDKPSKPSKTDKPKDSSGTPSVKDEQIGTYMYLPETVAEELAYQFKLNSAEFERATSTEFEKNRHWYPLVISLGLEQVEEMDPDEMQAALASIHD